MKNPLREPLLHFLLLGAVIFAVHAWRQRGELGGENKDAQRIEVNAAVISRLREGWTRQFHRTPNADDMLGLVEAHIREEVLCREALAMRLDREDTIVRRRMAQKMEFLTQDISTAVAPDEATLAKYFADHEARYAQPAQVSFRHVYFSREKRGATLDAVAREALAALAQPGAPEESFGDPFLPGFEFSMQTEPDVVSVFGAAFAVEVMKAAANTWSGPVVSSYGVHLVRVTARVEPRPAELAAVREVVLRDFQDERRRAANDEVVTRLKQNYQIIIDDVALKAGVVPDAATNSRP
ncbi:MAG: peptidyl-prolyl cis-trans isomerase [Verrucomicrobiales bacterium]|nr:peptidyl-prolyl cis-trans isomerase [Verrucomicrobiales bacterium]